MIIVPGDDYCHRLAVLARNLRHGAQSAQLKINGGETGRGRVARASLASIDTRRKVLHDEFVTRRIGE